MKRISYLVLISLFVVFAIQPLTAQDEAAAEDTSMVEEYYEADSPLAGYTVGLNAGYPLVTGEFYKDRTGPVVGLVFGTPYGFAVGPFNLGVGGGVEIAMMEEQAIGVFASVNSTVYTTPAGPISVYGGAGYYNGLGLLGGAYFDYMVPNMPIVVKPYVRATISTSAAKDASGSNAPTGWIMGGVMLLYDLSF